jgi:hypothetical protein
MNSRAALLLRLLGVLGVVVGVFAMHSLTGHHEAAMTDMRLPAAAQAVPAAHGSAEAMESSQPASGHQLALPNGHEVALPIALVDAIDRVAITPVGEQHGMVSACVAVLTALLLLLALVLGLRNLLAWRPVLLVAPAQRVVLSERSPPWLTPSLSKLCVLRT